MKPIVNVVRAVGAEFVRRLLKPVIIAGLVVLAVLLAAGVWLVVSVNAWWWFFLAPVIFAGLVFAVLLIVVRVLLKLADSTQNRDQKRAVRDYVDKLQRVAENLQTPQYVILFRVVRDVARPRPDGFIESVSRDSKTLAPDFKRLTTLF